MTQSTPQQREIASELDRVLLDVLKNGQEQAGPDGTIVRVKPSAALLNVIRSRLKDLGVNSVPVEDSPAGDLVAEARRRGMTFNGRPIGGPKNLPPMSEDEDAAIG